MQVVAWGRQRGLARAPCRFAPCFAGLPWTSHESIGDSNCSTSFITSFNHLHHHSPRGECRFQSERNSVASDLWRRTPQKLKAKRRKPSKAFGYSSSQILVDESFSFCTLREGGRSLKRRELFHASQPQIPRPALPYSSCLVPCYLIVPTSSSLVQLNHSQKSGPMVRVQSGELA